VMLEALACGVPVAALPVPGPLDVVGNSGAGALEWDLRAAAMAALEIPRKLCRSHAERFSWQTSIEQFLSHVVSVGDVGTADIHDKAHGNPLVEEKMRPLITSFSEHLDGVRETTNRDANDRRRGCPCPGA
jgi:hypothetical protein